MARSPCPAMIHLRARRTDRCHRKASISSFQGQLRADRALAEIVQLGPLMNFRSLRRSARHPSKALDQTGVDQQPVETARLGTAGAEIEQAAAAAEDLLLLGEGGAEWNARALEHHQRQVRRIEHVERGGQVARLEVQPLGRIIGGEIARVALEDVLRYLGPIERRVEELLGEQRLVVAEPHDEELILRKLAAETLLELREVVHAHLLAAQVFVDLVRVARIDPVGEQVGPVVVGPGKVVGGKIDEDENRTVAALLGDHAGGVVVIKNVGVGRAGAQLLGVEEMLDPGGGLETAGADEGARPGIEGVGLVAAPSQCMGQAALDAADGEPGGGLGKTSIGAHRQPGEHVVFGEPARPAGALDHERAQPAVGRAEAVAIAGRNLDVRKHGGVEARLVEHHDDVRQLAAGLAGVAAREAQAVGNGAVGLQDSLRHQIDRRNHPRAREFRDVLVQGELVLAPKLKTKPSTATPRRTRNCSLCQASTSTGTASRTARPTFQARPGMIVTRNENVATSTIMTSTNVAVIIMTLCLNCDTRIKMTIIASDSAADVTGRRSSDSQKQLSRIQVSAKAACAARSASDHSQMANAARWTAARSATRA